MRFRPYTDFFREFFRGFFRNAREKVIDGIVLLFALLFWLLTGKFKEHVWENILPWVGAFCVLIIFHSIRSGWILLNERSSESAWKIHESPILQPSGAKVQFLERREEVSYYFLKVFVSASLLVLLSALSFYLFWKNGATPELNNATTANRIPTPTEIADEVAKRLPISTNNANITEDISGRKEDRVTAVVSGKKNQIQRYVPSLDVTYDSSTKAFNLFNHGSTNLYLFGDKLGSGPRAIDEPRTITPQGAYHIWADSVAAEIQQKIDSTGELKTHFEVYVSTEDQKKHTLTYLLWARMKNGSLLVETQNLGYKDFEVEVPSFAVAIETKMMVPSPSKDIAGTGLWTLSRVGSNCYLRSVDTAIFIRIKNIQPTKVMITAYNLYGIGGELYRIRMDMNDPFMILRAGVIPRNSQGGGSFQMPAPSGNAGGGFFAIPFKDSDFSAAAIVQAQLLDRQLGEHYIEPGATVRGWAFFEYNPGTFLPVNLTMKISDDLGHDLSYRIPDEPGNPSGDTLQRLLNFGPTVDLSSCIRLPHPVSSP